VQGSQAAETVGGVFGGSRTSTSTVSDAEPPRPSETRTRMVTGPVSSGAVQRAVSPSVSPWKLPSPAVHLYVSGSPSGSSAVAVRRTSPPGGTVQGSHAAETVGGVFGSRTRTSTVSDAEPPRPSETCTRMVTRPVSPGAVQRAVSRSVAPRKLPSPAVHA